MDGLLGEKVKNLVLYLEICPTYSVVGTCE